MDLESQEQPSDTCQYYTDQGEEITEIIVDDQRRRRQWENLRLQQKLKKKIKKAKIDVSLTILDRQQKIRMLRRKQQKNNIYRRHKLLQSILHQLSVRKHVINSMKNFINKYKNKIKIFVHEQELIIDMTNVQINVSQRKTVLFIRQLKLGLKDQLGKTASSLKDVEDIQIQDQLNNLFSNLFKLLQFILNKKIKYIGSAQIDSFDFLCFPLTTCEETLFPKTPIFIGGLRFTCMKFFRKLIQMILNHKQLLLEDIRPKFTEFTEMEQSQIVDKIRNYINQKHDDLRIYSNQHLQQRINQQMKDKIFIEVINDFNDNVFHITQDGFGFPYRMNSKNLDDITIQSYKLHKLKKIFYHINDRSNVKENGKINKDMEIKLVKYRFSGQFFRKIPISINQELIFQLDEIHQWFQQKVIEDIENGYYTPQEIVFHGQNRNAKIEFLLFRSGEFHLYGSNKQKCDVYRVKVENHFLRSMGVRSTNQSYCYRSRLGIRCEPTILQRIPHFRKKLTGLLRTEIKQSMQKRKKLMIETRLTVQKRLYYTQQERQILYNQPFQSYVRYHHKQEQNSKEQITVDITPEGYVRIIGNINQQKAQKILKFIRLKIQQQITKDNEQFDNLRRQASQCYEFCLSNNQQQNILQTLINNQINNLNPYNHQFKIRKILQQRGLGQIINRNYPNKSQNKRNLKIVIWNIQQNKYGGQQKYPKNPYSRFNQFCKWNKTRLNLILQKIKQEKADFICLQEASILFKRENRQEFKWFFEQTDYRYYIPKIEQRQNNKNFYRSVILSKFPVDFYGIQFPEFKYQNMSLCKFTLLLQGQQLKVLLSSIHLKSGGPQMRQSRQSQLRILQQLSNDFDLTILAGDFNIGQNLDTYPENSMLSSYIDIVKFMPNQERPITWIHVHKLYGLQRFDRILMKFQKEQRLEKIVNSLNCRIKIIGNQPCLPYEDMNRQEAQQNWKSTTLSDHFGVSAEIMFMKP